MGSTSVTSVAASGVLVATSGVVCDSSLFIIGNRYKHKNSDIWRCVNEDQCVPDKTGCSYRTTTRGVRLARQGCWCCACRSSSPVLHESYCRIPSRLTQFDMVSLICALSPHSCSDAYVHHKSIQVYSPWWRPLSGQDELTCVIETGWYNCGFNLFRFIAPAHL